MLLPRFSYLHCLKVLYSFIQLSLLSYLYCFKSCTPICNCPCFHIFSFVSPVLLYAFAPVFISLLFSVLYCCILLPLFSYLYCLKSYTAVWYCPCFHILTVFSLVLLYAFAPVFISLPLFSYLYCFQSCTAACYCPCFWQWYKAQKTWQGGSWTFRLQGMFQTHENHVCQMK